LKTLPLTDAVRRELASCPATAFAGSACYTTSTPVVELPRRRALPDFGGRWPRTSVTTGVAALRAGRKVRAALETRADGHGQKHDIACALDILNQGWYVGLAFQTWRRRR
jgi:hypothetical protein